MTAVLQRSQISSVACICMTSSTIRPVIQLIFYICTISISFWQWAILLWMFVSGHTNATCSFMLIEIKVIVKLEKSLRKSRRKDFSIFEKVCEQLQENLKTAQEKAAVNAKQYQELEQFCEIFQQNEGNYGFTLLSQAYFSLLIENIIHSHYFMLLFTYCTIEFHSTHTLYTTTHEHSCGSHNWFSQLSHFTLVPQWSSTGSFLTLGTTSH